MVHAQRNVGAMVSRSGLPLSTVSAMASVQILLHAVGDLQQDVELGDRGGLAAQAACAAWAASSAAVHPSASTGPPGEGPAGDGEILEIAAGRRGHPLARRCSCRIAVWIGGFEAETFELKHVHGLVPEVGMAAQGGSVAEHRY